MQICCVLVRVDWRVLSYLCKRLGVCAVSPKVSDTDLDETNVGRAKNKLTSKTRTGTSGRTSVSQRERHKSCLFERKT